MRNLVEENRRAVVFTLAAAAPIALGIYINIYTGVVSSHGNEYGFGPTIRDCHWWNLLIPISLLLIWCQYRVSSGPSTEFEVLRARLVCKMLEAACRSLVYPRGLEECPLRAIVSLIDPAKKIRIAKYSFNAITDPERQGEWPINFGVTGEAVSGKKVVLKELAADHHKSYTAAIRKSVQENVKTVLAAPILNPTRPRGQPLGVLAIDSNLTIQELGFDRGNIRLMAQSWADVLAMLISRQDLRDEVP